MEQLIIAAVFLAVALVVRRKDAFHFRWQPTRHTWVAIGAALLAFALSALLLAFPPSSLAARLIHYLGIYVLCGVAIPWGYTLLIERASPAALGLRRQRWRPSLLISLVLALLFLPLILTGADLSALNPGQVARAVVVLAGAGGLFELFLYYGFVHLRLEKAFGLLPAILLTSALYVSWHAGTQLPLEENVPLAVVKLFAVGIMYQSVFCLTRNLLIIWPFFHAMGVLIDFAVNLDEIALVSTAFPWALLSLAIMALSGLLLAWLARRRAATGTARTSASARPSS
jgi:membrane protease YdiL (CAAX protease family)